MKCAHVNPARKRKCEACGKERPARKRPAHEAARDLPYEFYVEINGGTEACGICGRPRSPERRHHRHHEHKGDGFPLGILCHVSVTDSTQRSTAVIRTTITPAAVHWARWCFETCLLYGCDPATAARVAAHFCDAIRKATDAR